MSTKKVLEAVLVALTVLLTAVQSVIGKKQGLVPAVKRSNVMAE